MSVKLFGLLLVFLFFTLIGFYQSYKLTRRRNNLGEILLFLNRMETNIRYRNDDIFTLVFECAEDILVPLKNAVDIEGYNGEIQSLPLEKQDKALLTKFFSGLGSTDIEGQLSHIKLYRELFNEQYQKSKEDIIKKSKLYRMLGLFSGLAFVVMFI